MYIQNTELCGNSHTTSQKYIGSSHLWRRTIRGLVILVRCHVNVWSIVNQSTPHQVSYRIHSNRRSCPNRRSPPFIIKLLKHKNRRSRFLYKKCIDFRSDFEPIIMHQLHVLLTFSALLLE